jgi:hypothetical protein
MTIDELQKKIEDLETRVKNLEDVLFSEPSDSKQNFTQSKKRSIKEFLLEKAPKGDVQKTLAIAYFLEKEQNAIMFTAKDIDECFRNAKEKPPTNTNLTIYQNIQKGFMMESQEKRDGKKTWCLTSTGEKVVESDFEKK